MAKKETARLFSGLTASSWPSSLADGKELTLRTATQAKRQESSGHPGKPCPCRERVPPGLSAHASNIQPASLGLWLSLRQGGFLEVILISAMRELRHRKGNSLGQGHTAIRE